MEFHFIEDHGGAAVRIRFATHVAPGSCGSVLIVPGRTEYIEKYDELGSELLERGFSTLIVEPRGQGLSTRAFCDRRKHYVESFDPLVGDIALAMASPEAGRLRGPWIGIGHSMGGHLLTRFIAENQSPICVAVLTAPLFGIRALSKGSKLAHSFVRMLCLLGLSRMYAPGQGSPQQMLRTRMSMRVLTSDKRRFAHDQETVRRNPDLALGGITLAWLNAALSSIALLRSPGYAEAINIPVCIFQAGKELIVDNRAMNDFVTRLPQGEIIRLKEARHELLRERDAIRHEFWQGFDGFVNSILNKNGAQG